MEIGIGRKEIEIKIDGQIEEERGGRWREGERESGRDEDRGRENVLFSRTSRNFCPPTLVRTYTFASKAESREQNVLDPAKKTSCGKTDLLVISIREDPQGDENSCSLEGTNEGRTLIRKKLNRKKMLNATRPSL